MRRHGYHRHRANTLKLCPVGLRNGLNDRRAAASIDAKPVIASPLFEFEVGNRKTHAGIWPGGKASARFSDMQSEAAILIWPCNARDICNFVSACCGDMHARTDAKGGAIDRLTDFRHVTVPIRTAERVEGYPPRNAGIDGLKPGIEPFRRSDTAARTRISERRRFGIACIGARCTSK